jgi:hypothetical protein
MSVMLLPCEASPDRRPHATKPPVKSLNPPQIIEQILRAAGVMFIDENGGGPSVRLRKPAKPKR